MSIRNFFKGVALVLTASIVLGTAGTAKYVSAAGNITLSGKSIVQKYGEIEGDWDASNSTLTLKGRANSDDPYKPIDAINVALNNTTGYSGTLKYSVYVEGKGWQEFKTAGNDAGLPNKGMRIEALKMELTGELATKYVIQYAVSIEKAGYSQGYVSDGTIAGSIGEPKKIEEIKIRIVPVNTSSTTNVNYRVHRDSVGWGTKWNKNGELSGGAGKGKQIDSIELTLSGYQYKGGITYRSSVEGKGWETNWSSDGATSGSSGKRLEAVAVKLTGDVADHYDVYYRVYVQSVGWLGWAKNGAVSGTEDLTYRLEAIQVVLTAKGSNPPGDVGGIKSAIDVAAINPRTPILPGRGVFKMPSGAKVSYAVKTADGWSVIKSDGQVLDVSEAITGIAVGVNVENSGDLGLYADLPYFGNPRYDAKDPYDVSYKLRIIDTGVKKIENISADLYGWNYKICYRVKTSKYGWMAWTTNGDSCGTDEVGNTITAIQMIVLPYDQTPDANLGNVTSDREESILTITDFPKQKILSDNNAFARWCLRTFPENASATAYINNNYHKAGYYYYSISATWPYKLGGKSRSKCDCTGFAVWVFKNYHKKKVKFNSHSMAFKTGKVVSYKNIRPGDLLCNCETYHGDVFFYIGKDEYGHDVILDGMTPKIGGKIKYVVPVIRYLDVETWAQHSKHYIKRK